MEEASYGREAGGPTKSAVVWSVEGLTAPVKRPCPTEPQGSTEDDLMWRHDFNRCPPERNAINLPKSTLSILFETISICSNMEFMRICRYNLSLYSPMRVAANRPGLDALSVAAAMLPDPPGACQLRMPCEC